MESLILQAININHVSKKNVNVENILHAIRDLVPLI